MFASSPPRGPFSSSGLRLCSAPGVVGSSHSRRFAVTRHERTRGLGDVEPARAPVRRTATLQRRAREEVHLDDTVDVRGGLDVLQWPTTNLPATAPHQESRTPADLCIQGLRKLCVLPVPTPFRRTHDRGEDLVIGLCGEGQNVLVDVPMEVALVGEHADSTSAMPDRCFVGACGRVAVARLPASDRDRD